MEKFKFDNFTINIDSSGNLEFSTKFLLQILLSNVENELHILNYSSLNIDKIINECKSEKKEPDPTIYQTDFHNKITLVKDISKSIISVEAYLKDLTKDDYLLIIGGERLVKYSKTKPIFKTEYYDLKTQVHFMEEEDWISFSEEIDRLFEKTQESLQGIVVNIKADNQSSKVILEALKQSDNMSITRVELINQSEEYEKLQREIFNKFTNTSLKEILLIIESNKSKLDSTTYNYMIAMAYLNHGDVSNTISVLESNYSNLRNEEKLILSDLLTVTGEKERSREILSELFESDKYLKGLMPATLRLYEESEEQKKWIDIALEIDPVDPSVLEFYGNWLSHNKDYIQAAKIFRQLRDVMKSPYYELVARMNDLLNAPPKKPRIAEDYIFNVIEENPQLKNEAKYRLANFYISTQDSILLAYSALKSTEFELDKPRVFEITKLKFDILSDVFKASKALRKLKPFSKAGDADVLSNERSKELLNCIPILASTSNGYLLWRSFIENCQIDSTWKRCIFNRLIECLVTIAEIDYSVDLNKSSIKLIEENYESKPGILLLRRIKSGEFPIDNNFSSLEEFVEVNIKYAEVYGDNEYKLWCRYYLSIIASLRGDHQLANNLALSTLEYYPRVNQTEKILCIYLGLLAWGNSQYRVGRQVEGIACVISAFQCAKKLEEFYPLVEEGINVIVRFISDNRELVSKEVKPLLNNFYETLKGYNNSLNHMWHFINASSDVLITELENDIMKNDLRDSDWAGKIVNLVSAYMSNKMEEKAVELINHHRDEVLEKLSIRMDIRYKVIFNWAQIYFYHVRNINGLKNALELLETAFNDIEHRRTVYHKEERASLGELSDEIYRFYLQICCLMYGLKENGLDIEEIMNKIENILPRISPRSIIEQKKYNVDKKIPSEMEDLQKKLHNLTEEYNNLYKKNNGDYELLSDKASQIKNLTEELKKNHPHYKSLQSSEEMKFHEIQNALTDGEIFYQYFVTNISIVTLLISKNTISLKPKLISNSKMSVQEVAKKFGVLIQQGSSYQDKSNDIEFINLELSKAIADDLIQYVSANKVNRIYVMQDYKMGLFPIIISSVNNICLIDKVKSIVNIVDYSVIGQSQHYHKNYSYRVGNRMFGNETDVSLNKINKWVESKKDQTFLVMENHSDNVDNIMEFCSNNNINTMIIYGHGVSDPKATILDGAQGVEGRKKLIRLEDILDHMDEVNNFVLISCSGGSPNSNSTENSSGSWADIFGKFCGNIVSCKWNVPTESTIFIINEMINFMMQSNLPIDEALILAQRKGKSHYKNPMYWAGIEFWAN